MEVVLGISAFFHDSAAALLINGELVGAVQEERFSRQKNDQAFPHQAIAYLLTENGLRSADVNWVAFYEKPFIKFERLLETYHAFAPKGRKSFLKAMPPWMKDKLFAKRSLSKSLKALGIAAPIRFPEHHLSHAASAFYPSPFTEAAILTIDGIGEWSSISIGVGTAKKIKVLKELHFPHSLGLLYSSFTYYCGFKVNEGEYKLMGLAPYGQHSALAQNYIALIKAHMVDIREDGSFLLNMAYFDYATGLRMANDKAWLKLFKIAKREADTPLEQAYMDLAYAIQTVTEEIVLKLAITTKRLTGLSQVVLAGGVALNCVANGKLQRANIFDDMWIQPAAGDAGGAIGAALALWHIELDKEREVQKEDSMLGSYLGPAYTDKDITQMMRRLGLQAERMDEAALLAEVAKLLSEGAVVGWFQGSMEFGPRALGNRSILADPRSEEVQRTLNLKIKHRESFRPFAPAVLAEDVAELFEHSQASPYMLTTSILRQELRYPLPPDYNHLPWKEKLYTVRSPYPAITHVDFSSRVQAVTANSNPLFYKLLSAFKALTGHGILINTSFNTRGRPIVCSPSDAYNCFIETDMDYLVIGSYILSKKL